MTGRERFISALRREPIQGVVPHFELVFFLTMETLGKVHPSHRSYHQWGQMSAAEQALHIHDMAECFTEIAKRYSHDAIFVHPNPDTEDTAERIIGRIRETTGDEYFLMMHGDPTFSMPDGESMMDFSVAMYEEPDRLKQEAEAAVERCLARAERFVKRGVQLDGFALCSDYCFNTNPYFTADQFAEFVAPYLRRVIDGYRSLGFYTIKHTDGNIMPILGQILDCGPDALHSLDPQGGVDLAYLKKTVGDRVCLIGNVNCGLLQTGTDAEVEADVLRALRDGMPGGGFIFSTSNCVYTGMDLARYELMCRLREQHGVYHHSIL